jgi:hypothetical protein
MNCPFEIKTKMAGPESWFLKNSFPWGMNPDWKLAVK